VSDATVGSEVTRVRATDADSGLNSRLAFALVSGDRDVVRVEPVTGTVTTTVPGRDLDYAGYRLVVAASDGGQAPLTSSVRLTVNVTSRTMTSQVGGRVGASLVVVVATVGVVVLLVFVAVAAVVVRHNWRRKASSQVRRPPTSSWRPVLGGDMSLNCEDDEAPSAALVAHLSGSVDATSRRDLWHSTATTLDATRDDRASTWLRSFDRSVVSSPAACPVSTLR